MKGFPKTFKTRRDLEVGVAMAKEDKAYRQQMRDVLLNIKENTTIKVLTPEAEERLRGQEEPEYKEEDWMDIDNPTCMKIRLGLTDEDIDKMIKEIA